MKGYGLQSDMPSTAYPCSIAKQVLDITCLFEGSTPLRLGLDRLLSSLPGGTLCQVLLVSLALLDKVTAMSAYA